MKCLNKAMLIGHVGKDPKIILSQHGVRYARFDLATNTYWFDKNGDKQESVEWHKISCSDKLSEICEKYIKSGSFVFVEGAIKTTKWKDEDGVEKRMHLINASNIILVGGKPDDINKFGEEPFKKSRSSFKDDFSKSLGIEDLKINKERESQRIEGLRKSLEDEDEDEIPF